MRRGRRLVAREPIKPAGNARAIDGIVRITGPHQSLIRWALGDVWVADDVASARQLSLQARVAVVTAGGELCRGGRLVMGGTREDSHGILTTRRELRDLAAELPTPRAALDLLHGEVAVSSARSPRRRTRAALDAEPHATTNRRSTSSRLAVRRSSVRLGDARR